MLNLKIKSGKLEFENEKNKQLLLSYIEPLWSGKPKKMYKLEVLKSGTIIEIIDLSNKNYHIIGRLPTCDITLAHPTISRYHAILQFRAVEDEQYKKGLYIYDLESTHGTFWNGNRIKSHMYVHLRSGHMIRLGCSQRKFIVLAPDDEEEESQYSVTELKKRKFENELKTQKLFDEENEKLMGTKSQPEGIDWGMGEDADEETDLIENPYAETNNEELFLNDPKKTLRGWFERYGYDLQYHIEDQGIGQFLCFVNLPMDHNLGGTIKAEAVVSGKKKEAVVQCALEACRILDRYGLLRQSNHEARKKKSRNWEEEDYYDSDEDNFLDRTGIIEKKREQRMRLAGKLESKAETYDSLLQEHTKLAEKIIQIENIIRLQKENKNEINDSNMDTLDAYMSTLESSTLNNTNIREMKIKLLNLRKKEIHLLKLIHIAKPANLPPLQSHRQSKEINLKNDIKNIKPVVESKKKLQSLKEDKIIQKLIEPNINLIEHKNQHAVNAVQEEIYKKNNDRDKDEINYKKNLKCIKSSKNNMDRVKQQNQEKIIKNTTTAQANIEKYEFREDFSMWLPPENQSGDGKTSLNKKFGY